MKIALFLPNWVGDLVMATPAMRALRDHYTSAQITGILRPNLAEVLSGTDLVDRQLLHDPQGNNPQRKSWGFARQLRKEKFDLAVVFPNSFRSGWWAWASGAKRRVGYSRNARRLFLTDALPAPFCKTPHPVLDDYLGLVQALGCPVNSRETELGTTPHAELRMDRFWWKRSDIAWGDASQSDITNRTGYVCLNTGGAFGTAKHWSAESFGQLARRIAWKLERRVLVLCGPAERDLARKITEIANHPAVVSLAEEELSIGLTKAAIRRSDLLVTTDSGPRHFAQPFQVPVVTLFGPTHQAWSETYYKKASHLQVAVPCGPCQRRECPLLHHRCMSDLSVETVFRTVQSQLQNRTQSRPPIEQDLLPLERAA